MAALRLRPSGVQLKLTFEGAVEGEELPDMSPGRANVAGSDFYDAASYPKLREFNRESVPRLALLISSQCLPLNVPSFNRSGPSSKGLMPPRGLHCGNMTCAQSRTTG